jgi:hypothetical protein
VLLTLFVCALQDIKLYIFRKQYLRYIGNLPDTVLNTYRLLFFYLLSYIHLFESDRVNCT